MINVEQTIISQYGNSATISQLITNMNDNIDPRSDIDTFFDFVFNVETAQGFGLDIWGRIVNIGRNLRIINSAYFGFSEANAYPFGEAPFYANLATTDVYRLADDAYRKIILIKALANISTLTARSVNQLLQNLFADRGRCYVTELGNMKFRYTFEFLLTPYELAIMTQGILPHPAGVGVDLFTTATPVFGFSEMGGSAAPFGQAPFKTEGRYYANV